MKNNLVNCAFYQKDEIKVFISDKIEARIEYPDGKIKIIPILDKHKYLMNLKHKGYKKGKYEKVDSTKLVGETFESKNYGPFIILACSKDHFCKDIFDIRFINTNYHCQVKKSQIINKSIRDKSVPMKLSKTLENGNQR